MTYFFSRFCLTTWCVLSLIILTISPSWECHAELVKNCRRHLDVPGSVTGPTGSVDTVEYRLAGGTFSCEDREGDSIISALNNLYGLPNIYGVVNGSVHALVRVSLSQPVKVWEYIWFRISDTKQLLFSSKEPAISSVYTCSSDPFLKPGVPCWLEKRSFPNKNGAFPRQFDERSPFYRLFLHWDQSHPLSLALISNKAKQELRQIGRRAGSFEILAPKNGKIYSHESDIVITVQQRLKKDEKPAKGAELLFYGPRGRTFSRFVSLTPSGFGIEVIKRSETPWPLEVGKWRVKAFKPYSNAGRVTSPWIDFTVKGGLAEIIEPVDGSQIPLGRINVVVRSQYGKNLSLQVRGPHRVQNVPLIFLGSKRECKSTIEIKSIGTCTLTVLSDSKPVATAQFKIVDPRDRASLGIPRRVAPSDGEKIKNNQVEVKISHVRGMTPVVELRPAHEVKGVKMNIPYQQKAVSRDGTVTTFTFLLPGGGETYWFRTRYNFAEAKWSKWYGFTVTAYKLDKPSVLEPVENSQHFPGFTRVMAYLPKPVKKLHDIEIQFQRAPLAPSKKRGLNMPHAYAPVELAWTWASPTSTPNTYIFHFTTRQPGQYRVRLRNLADGGKWSGWRRFAIVHPPVTGNVQAAHPSPAVHASPGKSPMGNIGSQILITSPAQGKTYTGHVPVSLSLLADGQEEAQLTLRWTWGWSAPPPAPGQIPEASVLPTPFLEKIATLKPGETYAADVPVADLIKARVEKLQHSDKGGSYMLVANVKIGDRLISRNIGPFYLGAISTPPSNSMTKSTSFSTSPSHSIRTDLKSLHAISGRSIHMAGKSSSSSTVAINPQPEPPGKTPSKAFMSDADLQVSGLSGFYRAPAVANIWLKNVVLGRVEFELRYRSNAGRPYRILKRPSHRLINVNRRVKMELSLKEAGDYMLRFKRRHGWTRWYFFRVAATPKLVRKTVQPSLGPRTINPQPEPPGKTSKKILSHSSFHIVRPTILKPTNNQRFLLMGRSVLVQAEIINSGNLPLTIQVERKEQNRFTPVKVSIQQRKNGAKTLVRFTLVQAGAYRLRAQPTVRGGQWSLWRSFQVDTMVRKGPVMKKMRPAFQHFGIKHN